jgi:hypothetical protein
LQSIQLEGFCNALRDQLQITRVVHFEYVKAKDLEKIGMSKPAIRRLLDAVKKIKTNQAPVRPAPLPPQSSSSSSSSSLVHVNKSHLTNSFLPLPPPSKPSKSSLFSTELLNLSKVKVEEETPTIKYSAMDETLNLLKIVQNYGTDVFGIIFIF